MTIEEKARAYDEALERCKEWASGTWGHSVDDSPKDIAEFIFPQLVESEDEIHRKWILEYLYDGLRKADEQFKDHFKSAINWLEKQKEPHFTKRNALFDKCVENCDPEIMKRVSDEVDEMLEKEQKPFDDTQEYLKGVDRVQNYKELTKFEKGFDRIADTYAHRKNKDGYNQPWYTKERAAEMLYWAKEELGLLDEQKPVQSEVEKEYVRTLKSLISDFLRGKEDVDREYYQQIFDWLDGRHIEQKPADDKAFEEWIDDWWRHHKVNNPDSYDNGYEIQFDERGFKNFCRGIRNMYANQNPAEWSEEDEKMAYFVNQFLEYHELSDPTANSCKKWFENRFKSLRPVSKESLQSWKPSEEQMKALNALNCHGDLSYVGQQSELISLYNDLKKLM